jgi:3'-phosphoadenosine 5'-phosphosulfate sulfotransferase (PAPS reductase)/FAD synthetase
MEQFIRGQRDKFRLIEASPQMDLVSYWQQHGLPSDLTPVDNALGTKGFVKMQPHTVCCFNNRILPILNAGLLDGMTALLHGQRVSDEAFSNHQGFCMGLCPQVETAGPIWEWSKAEVWDYIMARSLVTPEQYRDADIKCQTFGSLECAGCPARNTQSNRARAARISPALSRISLEVGSAIRAEAIAQLVEMEQEAADTAQEDRPARWQLARDALAASLQKRGGNGASLDDYEAAYLAGNAELFTDGDAALLAGIIKDPAGDILDVCLAGGSLPLINDILRPQAEIFAKLAGCKFIAIGGRRGWLGAWRRFEYMDPVAGKPYWTAAKVLTESPLDIQPLRAKMGQFRFQVILSF